MVDQHVDVPATAVEQAGQTGTARAAEVPLAVPPANEGKTVAAWTMVAFILVGAILVAFGIAAAQAWLDWAGAAVVLLGLVVGAVLRRAGYGQPPRRR